MAEDRTAARRHVNPYGLEPVSGSSGNSRPQNGYALVRLARNAAVLPPDLEIRRFYVAGFALGDAISQAQASACLENFLARHRDGRGLRALEERRGVTLQNFTWPQDGRNARLL